MDVLWIVLSGVAGLALGTGCMVGISKAGLNKNQQKAEQILKEAQNEAESRVKQAVLDGKTQAHDLRVEAEKEIKERKQESMELENKLLRREDNLNFRDEALNQKERQINEKMKSVADKLTSLDEKEKMPSVVFLVKMISLSLFACTNRATRSLACSYCSVASTPSS